jgi:uncharacterized membrane protein
MKMSVLDIFKLYAVTTGVFFALDLLWLGVISKDIYQRYLGHLLRPNPNWTVAILFYLLFIVGILVFVLLPSIAKDSLGQAILLGAFFGFITYMTYELTNYALVKDWPWQIVVIDIAWGTFLTAAVCAGSFLIYKAIN